VADLNPGGGGVITLTGLVSPSVSGVFSLTNQAVIAAAVDTDANNNTSAVSHTVDAEPPAVPSLLGPANGAVISDTTPTLAWGASPSPDVAGYRLDWNGTVMDVGDVTQFTASVLADGVYTWTVAAYDGLGNTSPYADAWSFTVDTTPPAPPMLVSPANGAVISDTTPTLIWGASPSPDVAGYRLDWNGTVMDVGDVTQFTASVLADGVYTWTVAAYDGLGNTSLYTDVWSFTIESASPQILDTAPGDGETDVAIGAAVVITFSEPINAATFAYTVAPDPGGWSAVWSGSGAVATLNHTPFDYQTTYTVTVTAASDLVGNPLSGAPVVWHFTTAKGQVYVYLPLVVRNSP
jgi:hypothetical protein